jgi:hypothetical protein
MAEGFEAASDQPVTDLPGGRWIKLAMKYEPPCFFRNGGNHFDRGVDLLLAERQ